MAFVPASSDEEEPTLAGEPITRKTDHGSALSIVGGCGCAVVDQVSVCVAPDLRVRTCTERWQQSVLCQQRQRQRQRPRATMAGRNTSSRTHDSGARELRPPLPAEGPRHKPGTGHKSLDISGSSRATSSNTEVVKRRAVAKPRKHVIVLSSDSDSDFEVVAPTAQVQLSVA